MACRVLNALYDQDILHTLRANCHCYVHGNSVGGTNPALLEAMACCPRVLALDCEFNREVLADTGSYFDRNSIAKAFRQISVAPATEAMRLRVRARYQWNAVSESYMRLCEMKDADYAPCNLQKGSTLPTAAV